ncbi:hypothetical protein GCM10022225_64040 [Plantactinospora mayteni]|uniref:Tox-PL domain-containing protein n=1 Tax=Plantactinospora mayteni TaxID=566021 RepID=A0ABQ4F0D2_9ACTN|nr:toxin glutamine deamidase domain-containing protein [Plantactinospora mayteni]GIH00333.1 hypothetical protein Pma05_69050 [Plantactinospora mayteni]
MAIEPPDWGEPWQQVWNLLVWLSTGGSSWPEANEDLVRQLAQAWREAGVGLSQTVAEASAERNALAESWAGPSGLMFQAEFSKVVDQAMPQLAALTQQVAQAADQAALDIEYEKLSVLIAVITCCLEIFAIIVLSFFTFGAALAAAAGPIGIARAAISAVFRWLQSRAAQSLGQFVLRAAIFEGLQELATDLTVQGIQALKGTRPEWDAENTGWATFAGIFIGGLAAATGPFANALGHRTPKNLLGDALRTGIDGAHEAGAEALGGAGVNGLRTGDWSIDTDGFVNNAAAEGLHGRLGQGRDDALDKFAKTPAVPAIPTPSFPLKPLPVPVAPTGPPPASPAPTGEQDSGGVSAPPVGTPVPAPPGGSGSGQPSGPGPAQPRTPVPAPPNPSGGGQPAPGGPDGSDPAGPPAQPGQPAQPQPQPSQPGPGQPGTPAPTQPDPPTAGDPGRPGPAPGGGVDTRPTAPDPPKPPPPEPVPPAHPDQHPATGRQQPSAPPAVGPASTGPTSVTPPASTGPTPTGAPGPTSVTPPAATAGGYLPPASTPPTSTGPTPTSTAPASGQVSTTPVGQAGTPSAPAPVNPAPANSGNPGPTNSGPTNPGPTNSGPTNPGPTNSGPTNPGPASTGSPGPANSGNPGPAGSGNGPSSSNNGPAGSPTGTGPTTTSTGTDARPTPAPIAATDQGPTAAASTGLLGVAATAHPEHHLPYRRPAAPVTDAATPPGPLAYRPAPADDLDPASAWDERELSSRVPVDDGQRTPVRHPDPRHPSRWVAYLNDGGPTRPGRATNCTDTVRAFLSTWYGNPSVSGSLNHDLPGGVANGTTRTERWLGGTFTHQGAGARGLDTVRSRLLAQGHGAATVVVTSWPEGGSHMWAAVNQHGTVVWVEPQSGEISDQAPLYQQKTDQVWALPLNPDGDPTTVHPDADPAVSTRPEEPTTHHPADDADGLGRTVPDAPGSQPGTGNQPPLVTGQNAIDAVRATMRAIPAGFDLTGGHVPSRYAAAIRPEPNVVKIVLTSSRGPDGGEVNLGTARMSGRDFAEAAKALRTELKLDSGQIVLVSNYSGIGLPGQPSLASVLARTLGKDVVGASAKVWTYPDGSVVVAEPERGTPHRPKKRPDGSWRTFDPSGRLGTSTRSTERTARPLPPDLRGDRRTDDDQVGTYRDSQNRLHRRGDPPGSFRDDATGRLHHDQDDVKRTYRDDRTFRLVSASTNQRIPDPLLARTKPVQHPVMAGTPGPKQRLADPATVTRTVAERRKAGSETPRTAARHILAADFGISGDAQLTQGVSGERWPGEFAVAGFDPDNQRLVVLETESPSRRDLLADGSIAEQGSPAHIRHVLRSSRRLHEHLRNHPHLRDALHRALARGELTVQAYRVEVKVSPPPAHPASGTPAQEKVDVTRTPIDLTGLDLTGVADWLPPRSTDVDGRLAERLNDVLQQQVVGALRGVPGIRDISPPTTPGVVEVRPEVGAPYQLDLRTAAQGPGDAFALQLDQHRKHELTFFHDQLDDLNRADLALTVTQAVLHVNARVSRADTSRPTMVQITPTVPALADQPPGRRPALTDSDVGRLGEFEALAHLASSAPTGPDQIRFRARIRDFVERYGLREGFPGAEDRQRLAREHLSPAAQRTLTEEARWEFSSDPAVAVTRSVLQTGLLNDSTRIKPVPGGRGALFQVEPEGWAKKGQAPFTIEVRSAPSTTRGSSAPQSFSIENTSVDRHFTLVVDPNLVDRTGATPRLPRGLSHLRNELRASLTRKIDEQGVRPAEVSRRLRDKALVSVPTVTGTLTMLWVADAVGVPAMAVKTAVIGAAEVAGQEALAADGKRDKLSGEHARQLALRADRGKLDTGDGLRDLVDRGFDEAVELAAGTVGRPDLVSRPSAQPTPAPAPTPPPIDPKQATDLRRRLRTAIEKLDAELKADPKVAKEDKHLRRVRHRGDDERYRFKIAGEGNDARVRVEVVHTDDPTKIEVEFAESEVVLRVPPDLRHLPDDKFEEVAREAVKEVADRQEKISQGEAGIAGHVEKAVTSTVTSVSPTVPAGEQVRENLGVATGISATVRSAVQAGIDRAAGRREKDLEDRRENHDTKHTSRLPAADRRSVANQIVALVRGGESVTRAIDVAVGGTRPAASTGRFPGLAPAKLAVTRGVNEVNRGLEHRLDRDLDAERRRSREGNTDTWVYRSDRFGIKRDVTLSLTFADTVEGDRPLVPVTRRLKRGHFEFTVNTKAAPEEIERWLRHACDNILFDRQQTLPARRRMLEDVMPAGVGLAGAAALAAVSGPWIGALAGITATGHLVTRWNARYHDMRKNDISLRKEFDVKDDDVSPQDLRRALAEQRAAVRDLEDHVRRIEERLTQDGRTKPQVEALAAELGRVPDHRLPDDVAGRVAAFRDLPRNGRVEPVPDSDHTFRVLFRGVKGRPEMLTFELGTGQTDGNTLMAYRVNSDVTHMLRVDPTGSPDDIATGVRAWLEQEMDRVGAAPAGLPSARARLTKFAGTITTQAAGTIAAAAAGTVSNPVASAAQVVTFIAAQEASNLSYDGNETLVSQARKELRKRTLGTAPEEQLAVFAFDTDHLRRRTVTIFHRLQQLERIGESLPEADRPPPFQAGPLTLPDRPLPLGD